ncbi:CNNM domain-containing protein, partial [Vibrio parahaemolyticus]|uniref:CNNM domain-containing protein n=1 Tax=Vibrio parahaemolyticus TaxID=670 RepID=UPI00211179FC
QARPFVFLLNVSTDALLKLMRQNENQGEIVTEEDIFDVVNEGSESGAIEPQEQLMIRKLLHLNDRLALSLMTPRCDIHFLDTNLPLDAIL